MHEVLVNRLGGLSLPRKSVVRLTDRPDMTLDVYNYNKKLFAALALMDVLGVFTSKNSFRTPKTDIKGVLRLPK